MSDDWLWYGLLVPAGFIAGLVNTLAGGGSFLTLPALMAVGLPPQVANGSNRIAILAQATFAAHLFQRQGHFDPTLIKRYGLPSLIGAVLGVLVAARLSAEIFESVFGLIFIIMALVFLANPKRLLATQRKPPHAPIVERLIFFAIGFYGGFIQAGAGVLLLMTMAVFSAQRLVVNNAVKLALMAGWQIVALLGYAWAGQVHWLAGCLLAVGNLPGAWLGARLAIGPKGDRLILAFLIVVMIATGVKLLLGF